jgi:hypothetical protein
MAQTAEIFPCKFRCNSSARPVFFRCKIPLRKQPKGCFSESFRRNLRHVGVPNKKIPLQQRKKSRAGARDI